MSETIEELKREVAKLRLENEILRLICHGGRNYDPELYGFKLTTKKIKSNGKEYEKLYAYNFINGKQIWVYVGREEKAKKKIRTWLEKRVARLRDDASKT